MSEFQMFGKIPRLFREVSVTEKLDGTNAQVVVPENEGEPLLVGSRNRWITPGKSTDNYGFAAWVAANERAIRLLGPGRHYGEWYGVGIARGYGLAERRWALFNHSQFKDGLPPGLPSNVHMTPVLYVGPFDLGHVAYLGAELLANGSKAVPGFMKPEGVVLYHKASGHLYKYTLDGDALTERKQPSPEEGP